MSINVTVWNEFLHEKKDDKVKEVYPNGMHQVIAEFLGVDQNLKVRTATLEEPEHGLTQEVLDNTDVLIWWAHIGHEEVSDEIVNRVYDRVNQGMGLIVLHSGHASKIFKKLLGTTPLDLKWREDGEKERLWVVNPSHPIAAGLGDYFELEHEEMYGEHFAIPNPTDVVFISWFAGGEVFRSGCTFDRGRGKIFYFRPGHEEYPTYYNKDVQTVIHNAVNWAAPLKGATVNYGHYDGASK